MALPKKVKNSLPLIPEKVGRERRQEMLDDITDYGTYLPKGVLHADLDRGMLDFVRDELECVVDGKKVSTILAREETELDEVSEDEDEIKVIKLQVSNEDVEDINSYEEADNLEFDGAEDLDEFNISDEIPEIADDYVDEILDLKYDEKPEENIKPLEVEETKFTSTSDFKTISINLGDDLAETIDYKKLQLPKLRSIAVEKGLASNSDASKLKKQDLLKLLGAE